MKVILSLDPIKFPLTGIGRYTYELAKAMTQSKHIESLQFIRNTRLCTSIPKLTQEPHFFNSLPRKLIKSRIAVELYRATAPHLKSWAIRGLKGHLYHGPNFFLPPFGGRSVVTIHDLSVYQWSWCHPAERVRYMRSEIELSLKRATVLITDSEFVRQEVIGQFGWPSEKVHAVPLASADIFYPREFSMITILLDQYGLSPGRYCLFSGTIEPRKNIDTLLDAYEMLPEPVRRKWPLVLTGYEGWNSDNLHRRIANAELAGWARYLGYVPADHLPILFAGARLFVFPSLYEGFGLPVLEAMASGVPVVCSNASSLPEIVGDAGAMCDALDVYALGQLILVGLENEQWRSAAIQKGLERAKLFSWQRCADETVAAYRSAFSV